MSVVLQVNLTWDASEEIAGGTLDDARELEYLHGLQWKIWLRNSDTKTSGGIYLFESIEAAEEWQKAVIPGLQGRVGVSNVTAVIFNVNEGASKITRAPLDVKAPKKA